MAKKATYSNLMFGIKVLASDNNSFNVNEKGYNLVTLLRSDVSRLPKKAELEKIKCDGVVSNIEKLYCEMVRFHSTTNESKAIRKNSLENIVKLEEIICNSLGLTLREDVNGEVYLTQTITINQYNFFEACFSIRHASKKVRTVDNNVIDVVSLSQFKKSVLFGLSEACANSGDLYAINGRNAKVIERIEKPTIKSEKAKKAKQDKKPVSEIKKEELPAEFQSMMEAMGMNIYQIMEIIKKQAEEKKANA